MLFTSDVRVGLADLAEAFGSSKWGLLFHRADCERKGEGGAGQEVCRMLGCFLQGALLDHSIWAKCPSCTSASQSMAQGPLTPGLTHPLSYLVLSGFQLPLPGQPHLHAHCTSSASCFGHSRSGAAKVVPCPRLVGRDAEKARGAGVEADEKIWLSWIRAEAIIDLSGMTVTWMVMSGWCHHLSGSDRT